MGPWCGGHDFAADMVGYSRLMETYEAGTLAQLRSPQRADRTRAGGSAARGLAVSGMIDAAADHRLVKPLTGFMNL
jgi:hypothetical protein